MYQYEEMGKMKPFVFRGKEKCCDPSSTDSDDFDRTFLVRLKIHRWQTKGILMRLGNSLVHSLPPNLGPIPITIDKTKTQVTPRIPYASIAEEAKYQEALVISRRKVNRLLGLELGVSAPLWDNKFDPTTDLQYGTAGGVSGMYFLSRSKFFFLHPAQTLEEFQHAFLQTNQPIFEVMDDHSQRLMYAAETLGLLQQKLKTKKTCCWCCKRFKKKDLLAFDRTTQPWEASFFGVNGAGLMHASRANTHDVTITDHFNDLCYIIRTDTGRFPRHYNLVDAKTQEIICQLGLPIPPDDEVLGNYDAFINGSQRVAKIRQGAWRFALQFDRNLYRMRYGMHVDPSLNPVIKAYLMVAVINANFTFNIMKEMEDKDTNDIKACNPEVWKSTYPTVDYKNPFINDHFYMDHALFFYHPWYVDPEGIKRLSSTSLTLNADLFFTRYIEDHFDYTYTHAEDNEVGLPYYKSMPARERMGRNLFWVSSNRLAISDKGYQDKVIPFDEIDFKARINRQKTNFKRKEGDLKKLNTVAPFSRILHHY